MILNSPIISGSLTVTGNISTSGSITLSGSIASSSFASTASFVALAQSASNAVSAVTASFANAFTVAGNLTAQTLVVQTITSSVDFVTGSTRFGSILDNTHVFSGSVTMNPGGLFVSSSGLVGIGTTTPTSVLEVQANQNSQTGIRVRNSTSGTSAGVEFGAYTNSGNGGFGKYSTANTPYKNISAASTYVYNGSSGDIALLNDVAAGNISFAAGGSSTAQMFINASGNVGIGTINPDRLLQVSNTSGQAVFSIVGATNDSTDIFLGDTDNKAEAVIRFINGANTFNILQGGSTRMTITASGSVGIGTNNPSTLFHINGSSSRTALITTSGALSGGFYDAFQILAANQTGGGLSLNVGKAESTNDLAKMVYFHVANGSTSNRLGFGFYANDALFNILASGNVGIGTTSPSGILTVAAAQNLSLFRSTTTTNYVEVQIENTTNYLQIGVEGASGNRMGGTIAYNAYLGSYANYGMTFHTNNLNRMTINSGGYVFINSTSNQLANATPQLGILAGSGTDAVNIKHTQNGNNTVNIWQTGTATFSALAFYKGDSQNVQGTISVTTSAVTYNSTSDYRLKENVVPLENGLDRLMQLKPSKFNWITTGEEAEGFIAHELQEIFPDAVTGEKDAIYSSTGNIKPQSVDYGRITPLLVKAIQELKAQNDDLQSQINELKAQ